MKTVITLMSCFVILCGCQLWFANLGSAEEPKVKIEPLSLPPMPIAKPDMGVTIGSRYILDADDNTQNKMRMFLKKEFLDVHSIKFAWTRKIGETANFFNYSANDNGTSYRDTGEIYIEYSYSF
jgi:hypothetical protein